MLDEIEHKPFIKTNKVINRGKRSKALSELTPVKNIGKNLQQKNNNPESSILGSTPFLLYINDVPDDVICEIVIYADNCFLF